jgi:hypothetical protein
MSTPKVNGRQPAKPFIPFPKISGEPKNFMLNLIRLKNTNKISGSIDIEGTAKLHGFHADIVFHPNSGNSLPTFQTRNRISAPNENVQGWPANIAKQPAALNVLKWKILNKWKENHNGRLPAANKPLIVAGEWIGPKVQEGVGVSQLSHRFVITDVCIQGEWQADIDYAIFEEPSAAIFSILRVPQYTVTFDLADCSYSNPAMVEMQQLSDKVEVECPFAASFGVKKSKGEGIVWKLAFPEGRADSRYWLKTKGPAFGLQNRIRGVPIIDDYNPNPTGDDQGESFASAPIENPQSNNEDTATASAPVPTPSTKPTYIRKPRTVEEEDERKYQASVWAREFATRRRLEQGFEYFKEMQMDISEDNIQEYVKWVLKDAIEEEYSTFEPLIADDRDFAELVGLMICLMAKDKFRLVLQKDGRFRE